MKTIHGAFISQPDRGQIYIAERSRKGTNKLIWSVMPEHSGTDVRTEARRIPRNNLPRRVDKFKTKEYKY